MESMDREILEWIAAHTGSPELTAQLTHAKVKKRDQLGTGFFVYFERVAGQPSVEGHVRPICPHIESRELLDGAGCDLFIRDGHIHYLEVYARGGFMPKSLEDFTLRKS